MSKPSHQTGSLEKLLQLKRWETPPPEHLDRISSRVIARIEADQAVPQETLWSRLCDFLDFKPVLACSYSAAAMGLLVFGLGMKDQVKPPPHWGQQGLPAPSHRTGIQLTGVPLQTETNEKAASFRLPSSANLWRSGVPVGSGSVHRSIQPVVQTSLSSPMSHPLGAPLLQHSRPSGFNPASSRPTAIPARFEP